MRICLWFVVLVCSGCGKKTDESKTAKDSVAAVAVESAEIQAVCVFEGISLRAEPNQNGKWISGISLGEKMTWLGETKHDDAGKVDYVKVRLSDGTEGWASANFIIPKSKAGAITASSFFYKRPDLSTVTDKSFEPLDFVAVTNDQGDWVEVTGKRRKNNYVEKGWLNKTGLSFDDKDVAVASMTAKAMSNNDAEKRKGDLEKILKNSAVASSQLLTEVQKLLADMSSYSSNTRRVKSDRAYFYGSPDENSKMGAYVVKGDFVTTTEFMGDFVRAAFSSTTGVTEGWLKVVDLE